ncbi:uncharacterized protein BX663DRAFT_495667 [Cokeromyces recurvatus]|uniref:uncharacterized protein n=1 Tax=Cokeromyces recurvatus TaxID=90255 RepID=UPI0022208E63|nr:uncharacterized protein BX663DRAFT_495667 [Cokeromyces recurvatus]KAI7907366.1 hypothetical protein BX663DRAFT_495667 [Cokeromyces recurvatus]
MPTFSSKLNRMKSVKLPFQHNNKRLPSPEIVVTTSLSTSKSGITPESIETIVSNKPSLFTFSETLEAITKEADRTQFDDVFGSFFFNDKRCQHRALFMAARLQQTLNKFIKFQDPIRMLSSLDHTTCVSSFWRLVTHRLYTLNYILFVLPSDSTTRADFLRRMEDDLKRQSDGLELTRRGGMEAHFAVRYALKYRRKRRKTLLEDAFKEEEEQKRRQKGEVIVGNHEDKEYDEIVAQAREVIEQCLESESSLAQNSERDAMYIFHSTRAGFLNAFQPRIELEEDRALRHRLRRMVEYNQSHQMVYDNPFEDEDLIVTEEEEEEANSCSSRSKSREVDSGFYDGWANMSTATTSA